MGQARYVSLHRLHAGIMNRVQTQGTKYEGIRFRRALLDTIPQIGTTLLFPSNRVPVLMLVRSIAHEYEFHNNKQTN